MRILIKGNWEKIKNDRSREEGEDWREEIEVDF